MNAWGASFGAWGASWGSQYEVEDVADSRRGRPQSTDEELQRIRDGWDQIEAARRAPAQVARPLVTRVPQAAPSTATISDGETMSEHDTLVLLSALADLDD